MPSAASAKAAKNGRLGTGGKFPQQTARDPMHARSFFALAMVVPAQMQCPMHREAGDLIGERCSVLARLAASCFVRYQDVTEGFPIARTIAERKRKNVSRRYRDRGSVDSSRRIVRSFVITTLTSPRTRGETRAST